MANCLAELPKTFAHSIHQLHCTQHLLGSLLLAETHVGNVSECAGLYHPKFQLLLAQHQVLLRILWLYNVPCLHASHLSIWYWVPICESLWHGFMLSGMRQVTSYKGTARLYQFINTSARNTGFGSVGDKPRCYQLLCPAFRRWSQDASSDQSTTCIFPWGFCSKPTAERCQWQPYMLLIIGGRQHRHGSSNSACAVFAIQVYKLRTTFGKCCESYIRSSWHSFLFYCTMRWWHLQDSRICKLGNCRGKTWRRSTHYYAQERRQTGHWKCRWPDIAVAKKVHTCQLWNFGGQNHSYHEPQGAGMVTFCCVCVYLLVLQFTEVSVAFDVNRRVFAWMKQATWLKVNHHQMLVNKW